MAFQLKKNEPLSHGARRIIREQTSKVQKCLTLASRGKKTKVQVHEARKSLKKLRAIHELFRRDISKKKYHKYTNCYQGVAHHLAPTRDADVMIDTLKKLSQLNAGHVPKTVFRKPLQYLQTKSQGLAHGSLKRKDFLHYNEVLLRNGAADPKKVWKGLPHRWKTLNQGLKPLYKKSANAFSKTKQERTLEHFHQWRKSVKQLWYSLRILKVLEPVTFNSIDHKLSQLEALLGEDHDFAVLDQTLRNAGKKIGDATIVLNLIKKRQRVLQNKALRIGSSFYTKKPSQFTAFFYTGWEKNVNKNQ